MHPGPEPQTPPAPLADLDSVGPTATRLRLGAHLRQLRVTAGATQKDAAAAIGGSESKISRLELGRTTASLRDLADLLRRYDADPADHASVMTLAQLGNSTSWALEYADALSPWQVRHIDLEQGASMIRSYEPRFIPPLLQTPEYTRALLANLCAYRPVDWRERRLAVLLRRQQILHREDPPHVWMVIDEGALRRRMGGPEVMRAQLDHLTELSRLRHVNIQVLPFQADGNAACGNPVELLRFAGDQLPDVACLRYWDAAVYPTRRAEVEHYWDILNQLVTQAEPPILSGLVIEQLRSAR